MRRVLFWLTAAAITIACIAIAMIYSIASTPPASNAGNYGRAFPGSF